MSKPTEPLTDEQLDEIGGRCLDALAVIREGKPDWSAALVASARDVPTLLGEIGRLTECLRDCWNLLENASQDFADIANGKRTGGNAQSLAAAAYGCVLSLLAKQQAPGHKEKAKP